jgi:ZIP family zinc transporter
MDEPDRSFFLSAHVIMLLATTAAGTCMLLGGVIAQFERFQSKWLETELRHAVIAFGGGVLLSAIALVLIPQGLARIPSAGTASLLFLLGGLSFFVFERLLASGKHAAPQLSAMLLDYVPESMALGAMYALGSTQATLLALLIGLQNLPEGFNAYRELAASENKQSRHTLKLMAALIPLGPIMGVLGWFYGAAHPVFLGGLMLFAAGGILYLIFQDIAPQSRLKRHWGPALGAVLGFAAGLLGQMLVET